MDISMFRVYLSLKLMRIQSLSSQDWLGKANRNLQPQYTIWPRNGLVGGWLYLDECLSASKATSTGATQVWSLRWRSFCLAKKCNYETEKNYSGWGKRKGNENCYLVELGEEVIQELGPHSFRFFRLRQICSKTDHFCSKIDHSVPPWASLRTSYGWC